MWAIWPTRKSQSPSYFQPPHLAKTRPNWSLSLVISNDGFSSRFFSSAAQHRPAASPRNSHDDAIQSGLRILVSPEFIIVLSSDTIQTGATIMLQRRSGVNE